MKTEIDIMLNTIEKCYGFNRKANCTLYYDESNNIRKARLTENGTNNDIEHLYFVLGGIAVPIGKEEVVENFINKIPQNEREGEKKFKYFSHQKSDFVDCLKSDRLSELFQYIYDNKIYIHLDVFHVVYWVLIDIIDSLFDGYEYEALYYKYNYAFKSDFIEVLYADYNVLIKILYKYTFPNIEKENIRNFVIDIFDLYEDNFNNYYYENNIYNFSKETLRQMIKARRKIGDLSYVEQGDDYELFNGFYQRYLLAMCTLQDKKVFDIEKDVIKTIEKTDKQYADKTNSVFIDSKDCFGVQLSDCICGFTAKLLNYISCNSIDNLTKWIKKMNINSNEYKTLSLYFGIHNYSLNYSKYFLCRSIPLYIEEKVNYVMEMITRKGDK